MKRTETVNTFTEGLVMDLNPITTPNNVLTNALNATLITYNGNEYVLLNDMGNGRVETAYLPEGYVPLGVTELGGIIYVVSYNPLIDKCLIGSFPSPERNITTDELGLKVSLSMLDFYNSDGMISSPSKKLILLDKELHPGDKFLIYCTELERVNYISAKLEGNTNPDAFPKYLKLNVVAIRNDGQITNLNNTLVWLDNNYYIMENEILMKGDGSLDLDEYRNLISSNYNVFNSKVDGKLAILAELECIDLFDVSWDAIKSGDNWNLYLFLNWTYDNETSLDKINLNSIKVVSSNGLTWELEITNYPKSSNIQTNDIMLNLNTTFYTPYYVDNIDEELPNYLQNGGITTARYNNGNDNLFILTTPMVINPDTTGVVSFTVYPGMPFGYLSYLALQFSIDFSKLGTGAIDLVEYRYFWEPGSISLNWGLNAYPERNKEIKFVNFNFYTIVLRSVNWITDNYLNIDNSRVIITLGSSIWETGQAFNEVGIDPIASYTINGYSSYSGNFSEDIDFLEDYNLYLVEIEINYNDEKTIKYYRFLYTSQIFNDYYFTLDDFKNIVLQEAFDTYYPLSCSMSGLRTSNVNNSSTLVNPDGEEVTTIPSFIDTDSETTRHIYTIKSSYSSDITFGVICSNNNSTFKFDVQSLVLDGDPAIDVSHDAVVTTDNNLGTTSSGSTIDELIITPKLEGSVQDVLYFGSFSLTIEAPFVVDYLTEGLVLIPYELVPLTVLVLWLLVHGKSKYINLCLGESYSPACIVMDGFGDDSSVSERFNYYQNVYQEVKNRLLTADIIVLNFRTRDDSKSGDLGKYTVVGKGDWYGGEEATFAYQRFFFTNNFDDDGVIILYAMATNNNEVLLFTFGKTGDNDTQWYGESPSAAIYVDNMLSGRLPFGLSLPLAEDTTYITKPFTKYYKLLELDGTMTVRNWTRATYYKAYTWNDTITYNCSGVIQMSINDVLINNVDNLPNNLKYSPLLTFILKINLSENEDYSQYLDYLMNTVSTDVRVLKPDNTVVLGQFSPKRIYDENLNEIKSLMLDNGDENTPLLDMKVSTHKISVTDNRLTISLGSIKDNLRVKVMGRQEELNICINDIIQINDV